MGEGGRIEEHASRFEPPDRFFPKDLPSPKLPVIAVPTSIGYGASFGGIAALLGMLNSCASGVSVVNIDNGFGAASVASLINHL